MSLKEKRVASEIAISLLLAASLALAACAAHNGGGPRPAEPLLFAPRPAYLIRDLADYYPDASRRASDVGEVVLHFHIGPDNKAQQPFVVDVPRTTGNARLINGAQKIFMGSRYEAGESYRHDVTASVLFEVMPCGVLQPTAGLDYYYRLCIPKFHPEPVPVY